MPTGNYIVKINSKCNLNCCFCADDLHARSKEDFNYEELVRDLELNRQRFDTLIISGGEPTIYPNLLKYLVHAKKTCKYQKIHLTTNGTLLHSQENVDRLIRHGVDVFLISFSHSNEKMFDAIVKKQGSFQHIVEGITHVKKKGKEVRVNAVIHKLNYRALPEIVRFFISLKVNAIQLSFINPVGTSVVKGTSYLAIPFSEAMPFIRRSFEVAKHEEFEQLYLENVPVCAAPDLITKISDLRKPEENKNYYNREKTKPDKCGSCSFVGMCDGVWKAHLAHFGENEVHPVSSQQAIRIENHLTSSIR